MRHPFEDIRDGKTGGARLLFRAFDAFRRSVEIPKKGLKPGEALVWDLPETAVILREGPVVDEETQERRGGLSAVFTDPKGPHVAVAKRGSDRAVDMVRALPAIKLRQLTIDFTVDARDRAAKWAETHGFDLLTDETRKTREAMETLAGRLFRGEEPMKEAARLIAGIKGFGLSPRLEAQLHKKVAEWTADPDVNRRTATRRARKLHKRLLVRRASDVWAFVKRDAVMEGARQAWEVGLSVGEIEPTRRLVWIHPGPTRPGHPCPRCGSLVGTTTTILSNFTGKPVRGGGKLDGTLITRRRPPLHNLCDCELVIR